MASVRIVITLAERGDGSFRGCVLPHSYFFLMKSFLQDTYDGFPNPRRNFKEPRADKQSLQQRTKEVRGRRVKLSPDCAFTWLGTWLSW